MLTALAILMKALALWNTRRTLLKECYWQYLHCIAKKFLVIADKKEKYIIIC